MRSVVLFSGGLDSYATLLLAREVSDVVAVIHVRYGQPHGSQEYGAARKLAGCELTVLDINKINQVGDIFIGRNSILLSLAASIAIGEGATSVWAGFCQADAEGFPDCRPAFVEAQQYALRIALDMSEFEIVTPLIKKSKRDVFSILAERDALEYAIEHTHTCYRGDHSTRHVWGYGCGMCNACAVRSSALR